MPLARRCAMLQIDDVVRVLVALLWGLEFCTVRAQQFRDYIPGGARVHDTT